MPSNWQRRSEQFEKWRGAVYWFSVIFLLTGLVLIGFSTWAFMANPLNVLASILPVSFIVTGVFIFVVSFLGWYSSTRESARLIALYIFFIVVSICIVFSLTVVTFYSDERQACKVWDGLHSNEDILQITPNLRSKWADEYELYMSNKTAYVESNLWVIENNYYCCGFGNSTDMPVPDNCVDLIVTEVEGCHNDLYEVNHDALNDVRITGLAASFVQLIGLVFACLAMHYAPTRKDRDELLNEETERLNQQWNQSVVISSGK